MTTLSNEANTATESAPASTDSVFTLNLRWFVALCSVAAGLWHILYAFPHIDHHVLLGQSFLATGVLQIAWAAWLIKNPSRQITVIGGIVAFASTVLWVFAHSTGVTWYPGLETPEIIGWGDTVTKWFELFLVLGVIGLLLPKSVFEPATRNRPNIKVVGFMAVAIASVLAVNYVGAYNPEHQTGGVHTHGPADTSTTTTTTSMDHHATDTTAMDHHATDTTAMDHSAPHEH